MTIPQPIAIWNFDNDRVDEIGAVTLAVAGSAPTYEAGPFGSEVAITHDSILSSSVAAFSALAATGVAFTLSTWLKFTSGFLTADTGQYAGGIRLRVPGTAPNSWKIGLEGFFYFAGDMYLNVPAASGGWADEVITPPLAAGWHNVVLAYTGTHMTVYINGVAIGAARAMVRQQTGSSSDTLDMTNQSFAMPRGQTAVWNVVLTQEQVTELAAGLAWANPWSAGGGAGAVQQRKRLLLLEGQSA